MSCILLQCLKSWHVLYFTVMSQIQSPLSDLLQAKLWKNQVTSKSPHQQQEGKRKLGLLLIFLGVKPIAKKHYNIVQNSSGKVRRKNKLPFPVNC